MAIQVHDMRAWQTILTSADHRHATSAAAMEPDAIILFTIASNGSAQPIGRSGNIAN
jgi:hypothetical protein